MTNLVAWIHVGVNYERGFGVARYCGFRVDPGVGGARPPARARPAMGLGSLVWSPRLVPGWRTMAKRAGGWA